MAQQQHQHAPSHRTSVVEEAMDDAAAAAGRKREGDDQRHHRAPLRKGKWTVEEEAYANRIIHYFNQGLLPIPAGTTLRTYLSERLHCDPMRITKKFAGASCIGKQVFAPCEHTPANANDMQLCEEDLSRLESVFVGRVEQKSVTFALGISKDHKTVQDWLGHAPAAARCSSTRGKGVENVGNRASVAAFSPASMKRASSAPDLGGLAQFVEMEDKRRRLACIDEDLSYVDDKAAGDLLLDFFKKLHADHAQAEHSCAEVKPSDCNHVGSKRPIAECTTNQNHSWNQPSVSPESKIPKLRHDPPSGPAAEEASEEHTSPYSSISLSRVPGPFPNVIPLRPPFITPHSHDDANDLPPDIPCHSRASVSVSVSCMDEPGHPLPFAHSPARYTSMPSPALKRNKSDTALQDMSVCVPSLKRAISPRSRDVACWILKLKPAQTHKHTPHVEEESLVVTSTPSGARTPTPA